jgi:hypothetical protein
MIAVPVATPITNPAGVIDAIDGLVLLQVPPPVASVSVVFDPTHTFVEPEMPAGAAGGSTTVKLVVCVVEPHTLVTV